MEMEAPAPAAAGPRAITSPTRKSPCRQMVSVRERAHRDGDIGMEAALSELTISFADSESDEAKRRRSRTNFSQWQLEELERVFQSCHYPDVFMREAMALKLDLKESRISVSQENVAIAAIIVT